MISANTDLPTFNIPFPSLINPHVEAVEQHTTEWVQRFGLVRSEKALARFRASKFAQLVARVSPNADFESLAISNDWNVWLFMLDDQCEEADFGRNAAVLRRYFDDLLELLEHSLMAELNPIGELQTSLYELWGRMRQKATPEWEQRFLNRVGAYFEAGVWEAKNRENDLKPGLQEYIQRRRDTGAVYTAFELIDLTDHVSLPVEVRKREDVQCLTMWANDATCWTNDVLSLAKELLHGHDHNLVVILQRERQLSQTQASIAAIKMVNDRVQDYLHLEQRLPSFGADVDSQLKSYLNGLHLWMRGNLDWSLESGRYMPTKEVSA